MANSNTHWLAVYIWNDDIVGAQRIIGLPDLDHDAALLEVIRSSTTIFSNGLRIIEKMLNGHLIKDTAAIIQACVLHGNTAILSLVIDKYTTINRDWFYYALSQLTENVFMATRAHVVARWIINYAAEHAYTMPTHDLLELINLADKTTAYAALDAIYDNSAHYKIFINHLTLSTKCQLSPNAELYLYDNGKRKYTVAEYAAATLRSVMSSLVCK